MRSRLAAKITRQIKHYFNYLELSNNQKIPVTINLDVNKLKSKRDENTRKKA